MKSDGYAKPLPTVRAIDKPYWEGARVSEFRVQTCPDCAQLRFPPAEVCPSCLGLRFDWAVLSGRGVIWTRIFMHQIYYQSFAADVPYNIVWVEMDEGLMVTSSVIDAPRNEIVVGARVEVCFESVTEEFTLPKFRLADG